MHRHTNDICYPQGNANFTQLLQPLIFIVDINSNQILTKTLNRIGFFITPMYACKQKMPQSVLMTPISYPFVCTNYVIMSLIRHPNGYHILPISCLSGIRLDFLKAFPRILVGVKHITHIYIRRKYSESINFFSKKRKTWSKR